MTLWLPWSSPGGMRSRSGGTRSRRTRTSYAKALRQHIGSRLGPACVKPRRQVPRDELLDVLIRDLRPRLIAADDDAPSGALEEDEVRRQGADLVATDPGDSLERVVAVGHRPIMRTRVRGVLVCARLASTLARLISDDSLSLLLSESRSSPAWSLLGYVGSDDVARPAERRDLEKERSALALL